MSDRFCLICGEDDCDCEGPRVGDDLEDEKWGCCLGEKCLMPGDHMKSECHTAEMVERFERSILADAPVAVPVPVTPAQ